MKMTDLVIVNILLYDSAENIEVIVDSGANKEMIVDSTDKLKVIVDSAKSWA